MKLKTSFFNTTVLKKDITRFAPVWGLYTIFQVLFVLLWWEGAGSAAWLVTDAPEIMMCMGILNFCYAGLCALLLFGDLFKARMTNALHALPMRREGWFLTHLCAGMLFCLVPNLVGALLAALLLQQYSYAAFLWLAVMVLQYLFFFGAAAFSVMCAGNALGGIAVYSIFNFLAVLAAWLVVTFYEPVMYGVKLNTESFVSGSPTVRFTQSHYFYFEYDNMASSAKFTGFVPEDWQYLFIAAAIGTVLLGLAVLIYRQRKLESAGDFISLRPVAPVFLIIYTLCAGAVMYFVAEVFSDGLQYIFLLIGFGIGFFTGLMLLEKRVNVFRVKRFAQFGILTGAFVLSIVIALADPFGITRYVPAADQVAYVRICPYASPFYLSNESCVLTDPADIATITDIHANLVDRRTETNGINLTLQYEMKSGVTVERQYSLTTDSETTQTLRKFYSAAQCVLGTDDLSELLKNVQTLEFYPQTEKELPYLYLSNGTSADMGMMEKYEDDYPTVREQTVFTDSETAKGLFEAILADCEAGNMAQFWDYHNDTEAVGHINFSRYISRNQTHYQDITVFGDCVNTVAYLKALAAKAQTEAP